MTQERDHEYNMVSKEERPIGLMAAGERECNERMLVGQLRAQGRPEGKSMNQVEAQLDVLKKKITALSEKQSDLEIRLSSVLREEDLVQPEKDEDLKSPEDLVPFAARLRDMVSELEIQYQKGCSVIGRLEL